MPARMTCDDLACQTGERRAGDGPTRPSELLVAHDGADARHQLRRGLQTVIVAGVLARLAQRFFLVAAAHDVRAAGVGRDLTAIDDLSHWHLPRRGILHRRGAEIKLHHCALGICRDP